MSVTPQSFTFASPVAPPSSGALALLAPSKTARVSKSDFSSDSSDGFESVLANVRENSRNTDQNNNVTKSGSDTSPDHARNGTAGTRSRTRKSKTNTTDSKRSVDSSDDALQPEQTARATDQATLDSATEAQAAADDHGAAKAEPVKAEQDGATNPSSAAADGQQVIVQQPVIVEAKQQTPDNGGKDSAGASGPSQPAATAASALPPDAANKDDADDSQPKTAGAEGQRAFHKLVDANPPAAQKNSSIEAQAQEPSVPVAADVFNGDGAESPAQHEKPNGSPMKTAADQAASGKTVGSQSQDSGQASSTQTELGSILQQLAGQLGGQDQKAMADEGQAAVVVQKPVQGVDGVEKTASSSVPLISTNAQPGETQAADSAAAAQEAPPIDREQTLEQVVLGLRGKLDSKNGTAEIRLDPPNLGTLHVSISLQNGSLTASFQSGSDLVRDLLKGNLEKLKSTLESQGVAVDKLSVQAPQRTIEPSQTGGSTLGQTNPDGRGNGQQSGDQRPRSQTQQGDEAFARLWKDVQNKAPLDLVA